MYAKFVKLRYTWTAIALLIIIALIGIWYTQPTNVQGLDSTLEVESIQIALTQVREGVPNEQLESRTLALQKGDEDFEEVLTTLQSLELKRPFRNLMPAFPFLNGTREPGPFTDHAYRFRIELIGAGDRFMNLTCNIDQWEYRKSSYDADLPLKATENTEDPTVLGDFLWDLAA